MKVLVQCPSGHLFRCDETHLGKSVRCPQEGCGIKFRLIRIEPGSAAPPAGPAALEPPARLCPVCRQPVEPDAVICINCGAQQGTGTQTQTELTAAEADSTAIPEPPVDPELLAELESLRSKGTNWARSIAILAVSIAAFIALGFLHFNLAELLLIVLVILVHETGHLLAMIAFRYQNLRMFFIPLFGAAVSGRSTDAKGWKDAIVSLAGPVPGLFIGYALLLVYVHTDERLVGVASGMFIVLNALNLMPLFPLDGGHFFNEVVFSRSRTLEAVFRIAAALALLLLPLMAGMWILAAFGLLLLLGVPHTLRIIRVANRLRPEIPPDVLAGSGEIPSSVACRIAAAVRQKIPAPHQRPRLIAGEVDAIWQRLRSRPPGILASLALLATYAVSLLSVPVVPMVVMILIVRGSLPAPSNPWVTTAVAAYETGQAGGTDAHYAAAVGSTELLRQLTADGADVNARDLDGRTPLMCAARFSRVDCMRVLIDNGADVHLVDDAGQTALMWAAAARAPPEAVGMLLDAGADPAAVCDHGLTALDRANQRGGDEHVRRRIVELLEQAAVRGSPSAGTEGSGPSGPPDEPGQ